MCFFHICVPAVKDFKRDMESDVWGVLVLIVTIHPEPDVGRESRKES